ncbi:insulinase family protein [Miniphocaeibacter massiliensis]|uniref:insulinase family protein n=1 Tax=Miniphocaeibacter massiliensis TaxID=2041841 RepID=UPI000C1BD878|nr:insulinase family protein [Miniphocaeibacter massiliensis]
MNLHGFDLIKEEYIKDIDSNVKIFKHTRSGAKLMALQNDDNNKVFGIGFRTPPNNSTGVAHILEHCVLNGSRKFKTREPFMDLIKSSLQTFLNAMTFSDKTIYPIASRNDKDFHNLMDVYLDAVFYPAVKTKKEIFLQEGWHYELNNEDDDITYKGVVYNEMKGAYSSPDTIMYHAFAKGLFPNSIYGNESGGEPYSIPNLTYDNFLDFYNNYYHPINSYIFLYGNMDLEENLKFINDEYLANFEKIDLDSSIKLQPGFDKVRIIENKYSISSDENPENKDILIYGVKSGKKSDIIEATTNEILRSVLFSNDGSPIKLALLEKEIGEDIDDLSTDGLELGLGITAINSSKEKIDEFANIIETELANVVEKGVNKEQLEASLNKIEYSLRENGNFPTKGIIYFINSLDTWLYDEDPTLSFKYENILKNLRDKINTSYYEDFIKEKILNNTHKVIISLEATPGLNAQKDKEISEKLQNYKNSLSKEDLNNLIKENNILNDFQNREDTQEEKDTIPQLKLSDVDTNVTEIPTIEENKDDYKILFHPLFTGKINYVDFAFDLDFINEDEIYYVSLLCDLLGMVDTKKYAYTDLDTRIYLDTGGFNVSASTIVDFRKDNHYFKKLMVSSKSTVEKTEKMFNLIEEITLNSKFDNLKRIKEIIQIIKLKFESDVLESGHQYSILKSSSYFSQQGMFNEKLNGISYYDFIVELEENLENDFDKVTDKLKSLSKKIFNKNNMIFNITTDEDEKENLMELSNKYISKLYTEKLESYNLVFDLDKKNEGIMTSSNVNYVIKSCNLKDYGFKYNGSYQVLSNILSNTYLYNNIRAQGGAYGTGMGISQSGNVQFYSYRDPNIKNTIDIYDNTNSFLENLELSKDELSQFIIGSLSKFDPPMTNPTKGKVALTMYISGQTTENIRQNLEEALSTNLEDLKKFANSINFAMKENFMVTVGNSEQIKENKDLFGEIRQLKKM